jgi:hypothetical protein
MEHEEKIMRKRERVEGLEALLATHETAGNFQEARRVGLRLRRARQELQYMML